jgi:hypothetical protein
MRSFWNIDFDFAVQEGYAKTTVDSHAVGIREEDVADDLSVGEWMVRNRFLDCS